MNKEERFFFKKSHNSSYFSSVCNLRLLIVIPESSDPSMSSAESHHTVYLSHHHNHRECFAGLFSHGRRRRISILKSLERSFHFIASGVSVTGLNYSKCLLGYLHMAQNTKSQELLQAWPVYPCANGLYIPFPRLLYLS